MNSYILQDSSLLEISDRFVWASFDTDLMVNEHLVDKFGMTFWPAYFVVNPHDESVEGRRQGTMSVEQFKEFLCASEKNYLASRMNDGAIPSDDPLFAVREGDRAMTREDWKGAIAAYKRAIALAPKDWPRRAEVLGQLLAGYYLETDWQSCADVVEKEKNSIPRGPALVDVFDAAHICYSQLEGTEEKKKAFFESARDIIEKTLQESSQFMSIIDRSNALGLLKTLNEDLGDTEKSKAYANKQRELLDKAVEEAPSAWARMAFASARIQVYVELGIGAELIPFMEELIAELPSDLDPINQLAKLYLKLEDYERALATAKKAMGVAPKSRVPYVYYLIADIYKNMGNRDEEVKNLRQTLAAMNALPKSLQSERFMKKVKEALEEPQKRVE